MGSKQVVTRPGGTAKWTRDATTNDSDKSFTVPTGKEWEIVGIHVEIACTATVGNRQLRVLITDGTNNIHATTPSSAITANQTGVLELQTNHAVIAAGVSYVLASGTAPNVGQSGVLNRLRLPAGYVIRAYDFNAVDAAADDMIVVLHYIEYEA